MIRTTACLSGCAVSFIARSALLVLVPAIVVMISAGEAASQSGNCFGGPCIEITPRDGVWDNRPPSSADTVVNVRITYCSDKTIDWKSRRIEHNGVDVTGKFSLSPNGYAMCVFGGQASGTIVLTRENEGLHTISAQVETADGYLGFDMVRYRYLWDGYVAPSYMFAVSANSHTRAPPAGTADTAVFTITNLGNRPENATATATCTAGTTGCTLLGANRGRISLDTAMANRVQTLRIAYTAGAASDTAALTLRVTSETYASVTETAVTHVLVRPPEVSRPPGVIVAVANRVLARHLCLTASAGSAAASECGDLRLVHILPEVKTYNTTRAPTLIYSSQHAAPAPIVPLEVTLDSWTALPASVEATITRAGAVVGSGSWSGSDWGTPGNTRRLAVPLSITESGVHALDIEVRRLSGGSSQVIGSATLQLPVVNRAGSPFGAGWWLAGVEQLNTASMVWTGGDGSVRAYQAVPNQPTVWVADGIDRPDTLKFENGHYVRYLPGNVRVRFDAQGDHVETENRLGHITRFHHSTVAGRHGMDSMVVAAPGGGPTYRFIRDASTGFVNQVSAPAPAGATRMTNIVIDAAGRVTSIADPGLPPVVFSYTGASALVSGRTNRMGHTTYFTLDRSRLLRAEQTVDQYTVNGPTVIGTSFRPSELVGISAGPGSAQPIESAYTRIDGPRSDVDDITRIWTNSFGAPTTIRSPHGRDTKVIFGDPRWPGLATEVRTEAGLTSRAGYNARGLIDTAVTINPLGDGRSPVTRYFWNQSWAQPDSIRSPNGVVTSYGYDALGNVSYLQVGSDPSRRVSAAYWPSGHAAGLYRYSSVPGFSERDTVYYDPALGNTEAIVDRLGNRQLVENDEIGRIRAARIPIGSGRVRVDSTYYDAAGRTRRTVSHGPPQSFQSPAFNWTRSNPAEALFVDMTYDDESRVLRVKRSGSAAITGIDSAVTLYEYDEAGRRTEEREGSRRQTFRFDPAGNLIEHDVGLAIAPVSMEYDALGRMKRRIMPPVATPFRGCYELFYPLYSNCDPNFYLPFTSAGKLIAGDTATFAYDVAGNMTRADNRYARIRRSYAPNGLVLTDTLRIRTVRFDTEAYPNDPDGFQTHGYVLRHAYDSVGRRKSLTYPTQLCASCSVSYGYDDSATGMLSSVTDLAGQHVQFTYLPAGMLERVDYPGGVVERITYDAEGRSFRRSVHLAGGERVIDDSLAFDPLGRISFGRTWAAKVYRDRLVWNYYTGLGALAHMEQALSDGADPKREEFVNDPLGNRFRALQENFVSEAWRNPGRQQSRYDSEGRLVETWSTDHNWQPNPEYDNATLYQYDNAGNLRYTSNREWAPGAQDGPSNLSYAGHYYRADGKLAFFERRGHVAWTDGMDGPLSLGSRPVDEEYRYDALGRRVLVRAQHHCGSECQSTVQRFIWDGDQLVYETRGPGADTLTASALETETPSGGPHGEPQAYGRVAYTHVGGIDRPLAVHRYTYSETFYPHANWRGLYDGATNVAGQQIPCVSQSATCSNSPDIDWPGSSTSAFIGSTFPARTTPAVWAGSLVTEMADASGLLYRRNRYYDPVSGRFTQPDPIGVAGGLNLYGFAGGDPVNFSDPFGLSACPRGQIEIDGECQEPEVLGDPGLLSAIGPGGILKGVRALPAISRFARTLASTRSIASARFAFGPPSATNARLQGAIDQLFRSSDEIAGGTAAAIRHERATGELVGGVSHIQKGRERLTQLRRILQQEDLSRADRRTTQWLIRDLEGALR